MEKETRAVSVNRHIKQIDRSIVFAHVFKWICLVGMLWLFLHYVNAWVPQFFISYGISDGGGAHVESQ